MPEIQLTGQTDVGLKRNNNEDIFLIKPELGFCLVADGMGGASSGELASSIFGETASNYLGGAEGRSEAEMIDLVQKTFLYANDKILSHIRDHSLQKGMGCTAELVVFTDEGFVLGHVGDSRTYRLRNGRLKQLTKDHSLVQSHINQGLLTPEEARSHPLRNVILRAVGANEKLALDMIRGKIIPGDLLLLCSDGLTDMVDDAWIKEVMVAAISLPKKVESLIEMAKTAGGKDNITVVLAQIMED
ncbi:MAG: Stp1/IreP family PP2C-type Ser/Thr phosphatase [Desulfobacterales bacterium]|nr:Stp1/IreP family PP2C-type Ser/Thr phosphatase [Desulfobacterales bacterium]